MDSNTGLKFLEQVVLKTSSYGMPNEPAMFYVMLNRPVCDSGIIKMPAIRQRYEPCRTEPAQANKPLQRYLV